MSEDRSSAIRKLNDAFRQNPGMGLWLVTDGVQGRGASFVARAVAQVVAFNLFTGDNDPYGEHDFGSFDIDAKRLYWKIDYYNLDLSAGSEDPTDPEKTKRVLTIMLAEEY